MPNVVLDTNLLVSAFISASRDSIPRRAFRLARESGPPVVSSQLAAEIRGVLERPKFRRHGASQEAIDVFMDLLADVALRVEPTERVSDCRDPKDNMVLEAALAGGAEVIVTGDADLLALHPWRGVEILTPAEFCARFGA